MGQHLPDRLFWARDDQDASEQEGPDAEAQSESGAPRFVGIAAARGRARNALR